MASLNIGGPLAVASSYKIADSRQAGITPRTEVPSTGGPMVIKPEYSMVAIALDSRLGSPFEMGTSISVKTDVL